MMHKRLVLATAVLLIIPGVVAAQGRGKDVFLKNCASCHEITPVKGKAEKPAFMGPSLAGVGKKYNGAKIRDIIQNPQKLNPETLMPSFKSMKKKDLDPLVQYLVELK